MDELLDTNTFKGILYEYSRSEIAEGALRWIVKIPDPELEIRLQQRAYSNRGDEVWVGEYNDSLHDLMERYRERFYQSGQNMVKRHIRLPGYEVCDTCGKKMKGTGKVEIIRAQNVNDLLMYVDDCNLIYVGVATNPAGTIQTMSIPNAILHFLKYHSVHEGKVQRFPHGRHSGSYTQFLSADLAMIAQFMQERQDRMYADLGSLSEGPYIP